ARRACAWGRCARPSSWRRRRLSWRTAAAITSAKRSVEPGRARPLRSSCRQLAGLMMRDFPDLRFAHEQIAGDQGAAFELFFANDERDIAVQEHPLVVADDAR